MAGAMATIEGKGQAAAAAQTALSRSLSLKAAQPRYEAFLELVPAHIAQRARTLTGQPLARALSLWEKARDLAASAVPLSLDPQSVVFEQIGRAHVWTPVTNAHLVCRLLLDKKK